MNTTLNLLLSLMFVGLGVWTQPLMARPAQSSGITSDASCRHCACGGSHCCIDNSRPDDSGTPMAPPAKQSLVRIQDMPLTADFKGAARSFAIVLPKILPPLSATHPLPCALPAFQRFCSFLI